MVSGKRHEKVGRQLRMAWLQQLQAEFADICFQYRLHLQPPIFELTDSATTLGSWNARHRLLLISVHLIRSCPWQTTLQILKHEMAHQLCSEMFACNNDGHGRLFQQACGMLGLTAPFCRAKADCAGIPPVMDSVLSPRTEAGRRILSRVEKLLALAASDNEHEAALAMQRAGELLLRHNLNLQEVGKKRYRHLSLNTGKQRMPGYLRDTCALLQEFFFVRVVCASMYEPARDVRLRTIELFGRPENVAVAEHCYHFLTAKLLALWQRRRRRFAGGGQRARTSYFHGIIVGFREKLAAGTRQVNTAEATEKGTGNDLITQEDAGLQTFIADVYPRLRKGRGRKIFLHADAYREAVATGKALTLHRVVEETAPFAGGLLTQNTD